MTRTLVLCRSDQGDNGWSLHPPGSTDEEIANGSARVLASGFGDVCIEDSGPYPEDYRTAWVAMGPNTPRDIRIGVVFGSGSVDVHDRARAENAAVAVLNEAGVRAADACAEWDAQWNTLHDIDAMTGVARVWVNATEAADCALTEGWANPDGASCYIRA